MTVSNQGTSAGGGEATSSVTKSPGGLLLESFERARAGHGTLRDDRGERSYRDIGLQADGIARTLLAETGAADLAGERVALLADPGADFVAAFFGIALAGGVVVVLSPAHPPAESVYVCRDARVGRCLVSERLLPRARDLTEEGSLSLKVHSLARLADDDGDAGAPRPMLPTIAHDRPALQLYTSGTTGKPKGAVLTHGNLGTQQELLGRAWGMRQRDVLLHVLPLHHMHGLSIALLTAIGSGASVVMLGAFDAARTWQEMAGASVFMAVPTVYAKLLSAVPLASAETSEERQRMSAAARQLRLATSGSAALPTTLGEAWRELAGEYPLERFGMTEVGVALSNPLAGERRPGTVGTPLPSVEIRVVGEDGRDVPTGEVGELYVRGPSVFAGYFEREAADRESFITDAASESERWFRTGDTVSRSEDGYVTVLGRTSVDILKSGGYKLSALEIEAVLREHAAVEDVAVVGVPDETWGQRVVAAIIVRPEHTTDGAALADFARERLAAYKVPRSWFFVPDLPRTAVGKVKKRELTAELAARSAGHPDRNRALTVTDTVTEGGGAARALRS